MNIINEQMCYDNVVNMIDQGNIQGAREKIISVVTDAPEDISNDVLKQRVQLYMRTLWDKVAFNERKPIFDKEYGYYNTRDELVWWINAQLASMFVHKKIQKSNDELICRVVGYIYDNLDSSEMNQNVIANEFCISSSHLSRVFKSCLGRTYVEILSDFRIVKMIFLINSTNLKDKEIGNQIGIPDAHYLSIWFRKTTGFTVSEYRRMIKCNA